MKKYILAGYTYKAPIKNVLALRAGNSFLKISRPNIYLCIRDVVQVYRSCNLLYVYRTPAFRTTYKDPVKPFSKCHNLFC
jgi:hypothetical protein